ncbi:MAG: hypothetical protein HQL80_09615 [Magnetococcales bacterium]|nr:hypothetical protein [Magnetococcales bacterium]MBF0584474.1 hypothetical protein [Magnetococcales bacterium]
MIRTLIVWCVVLFLKKIGRKVDKKELVRYKKAYNGQRSTRIERRIERPKPTQAELLYNQHRASKSLPERVALYNKGGHMVRLNVGLDGKRYSAI